MNRPNENIWRSMSMYENILQLVNMWDYWQKHMTVHGHAWKSVKINENQQLLIQFMNINQRVWRSTNTYELSKWNTCEKQCTSVNINENAWCVCWSSMRTYGNHLTCTKIHWRSWTSQSMDMHEINNNVWRCMIVDENVWKTMDMHDYQWKHMKRIKGMTMCDYRWKNMDNARKRRQITVYQ